MKFTAKGYIEIGYELSADGKSILISVKDTGKGIPDDKKETTISIPMIWYKGYRAEYSKGAEGSQLC